MNKKETKLKVLEAKRTDYGIPTFGFKSSFVILVSAIIGSIIIPMILIGLGIDSKIANIIGNITVPGLGIAYARYFIESKRGICRGFFITYTLFSLSFGIITYFWRYHQLYM